MQSPAETGCDDTARSAGGQVLARMGCKIQTGVWYVQDVVAVAGNDDGEGKGKVYKVTKDGVDQVEDGAEKGEQKNVNQEEGENHVVVVARDLSFTVRV